MYTNAQYIAFNGVTTGIQCDINGISSLVPIDPANTDYQNIMKMQKEGELVIAPAEQ